MDDDQTLDKLYDPLVVEPNIYRRWEESGAFASKPDGRPHEKTFTIVIPPPNVTGALHLGHALNNTLQDILVRYHRMRGFNTLWQPGTDHAGIATQAVVERRIRESEGKTRHELGREELVRRIWEWKDQYESRILSQLKLMGCSCDWERNRFTLDDGLARAVRHMFFKLFGDGLIFRGKRLVNWDTQLQTAVSDDEVYYETVKGHFWHFAYPVIDPKHGEPEHVVIATTRPETMLGDTAVAVHPDPAGFFARHEAELRAGRTSAGEKERAEIDAKLEALAKRRASHLDQLVKLSKMACDGRMLMLPLVERPIPLICDEWADPTKGSGCVKITPAHDPNDYEVGLRHKLPMLNVLTADGLVAKIIEADGSENPRSKDYEGLTFAGEGREKVVADLEALGLLREVENHEHELGHSDRSRQAIEPYLSDQWFVQTGDVTAESQASACAEFQSPGTAPPSSHIRAAPDLDAGTSAEIVFSARSSGEEKVQDQAGVPESRTSAREKARGSGSRSLTGIVLGNGERAPGLAQAAMDVVNDGRVKVFPSRYSKSYLDWLGEKREWCISRQLWWGHRIPVWSTLEPDEGASSWQAETDSETILERSGIRRHSQLLAPAPRGSDSLIAKTHCLEEPVPGDLIAELEQGANFTQDPDVLDTWFSSGLWPFSTLGWPEQTEHVKQYYPGSVLCTSRDIITNWVARMVMFGLYAMGKVPFDHVYIHPKILDGRGETMSKSKGNGVDPVDVIHTHGADALRYTMADMTTETQDIRMPVEYICPHCESLVDQQLAIKAEEQSQKSRGEKLTRKLQPADCHRVKCTKKECGKEFATQWADEALKSELPVARETSDKFDIGRNFCNKLWNAARFAFMNLEGATCETLDVATLPPEDRWILAKLSQTVRNYHEHLAEYHFAASVKELRDFFWECLCDWYIELTKPRMSGDRGDAERQSARQVLAFCLDQVLRLWHPTIPFITERLWQQLNTIVPKRGLPGIVELACETDLIVATFPPVEGYGALDDDAIVATFSDLQDATRGVRELRSQCDVSPKERPAVTVVVSAENASGFEKHAHILKHMAGIGTLSVSTDAKRPRNAGSATVKGLRIYVHDVSDDDAERSRCEKALKILMKQIEGKESKLADARFVANAKAEVVELERTRLEELTSERNSLMAHLAELGA